MRMASVAIALSIGVTNVPPSVAENNPETTEYQIAQRPPRPKYRRVVRRRVVRRTPPNRVRAVRRTAPPRRPARPARPGRPPGPPGPPPR